MAKAPASLRLQNARNEIIALYLDGYLLVRPGEGANRLRDALNALRLVEDELDDVSLDAGLAAWWSLRRFNPLARLRRILPLRAL